MFSPQVLLSQFPKELVLPPRLFSPLPFFVFSFSQETVRQEIVFQESLPCTTRFGGMADEFCNFLFNDAFCLLRHRSGRASMRIDSLVTQLSLSFIELRTLRAEGEGAARSA